MTKPICKLTDDKGELYISYQKVIETLRSGGQHTEANECNHRLQLALTFEQALAITKEYVEVY